LRWKFLSKVAVGLVLGTLLMSEEAMANDCLVTNWQISRTVEDRVPIDLRTVFTQNDKRIFTFIKLSCTTPVHYVRFCFDRNAVQYSCIKQPVESPMHWRTWASVKALKGSWSVEVSVDKRKLLSDKFIVRQ
jgi:hypothetical protein